MTQDKDCAGCGKPIEMFRPYYIQNDPWGKGGPSRYFHSECGDPLGLKEKDSDAPNAVTRHRVKPSEMLKALPHLTQQELATLKAAIGHLQTKSVEADETLPLFHAMLRLLSVNLSFYTFQSTTAYKYWSKSAPAVTAFIDTTFPTATKVAKEAIMTVLLDTLIEDLKGRGVPITLGTVVTNIERVPQIFELMFPSYRQSGLAHLILKAMNKNDRMA